MPFPLVSLVKRETEAERILRRMREDTLKKIICEKEADLAGLKPGTPERELYVFACTERKRF